MKNQTFDFSSILNSTRTVLAILGILVGLVTWTNTQIATRNQELALIKKDIETIKTNDLEHLRGDVANVSSGLEELKTLSQEQREQFIRMESALAEILNRTGANR